MADEQIEKLHIDFEVNDNGSEDLEEISNALEKTQNQIDQFDTSKIDGALEKLPTGQAASGFNDLGASAINAANGIDRLFTSEGKIEGLEKNIAEARQELEELVKGGAGYENKDVKKLVSQIEKAEKQIEELGKDGEKSFDKINKSAKKTNKSTKKFGNGLKGLLRTAKQFLVFGAFFTIQRQVSQAFKEGANNLYQYSKAIDGTFAKSMDRLATSFQYLKNAIGAAVAPIINYFTPALERLIDTVAELANRLGGLFASLSGQNSYKKAIKSQKEYAAAVNSTNNALAKFDEINNISTSKGGGEADYGSMFEEVATPSDSLAEAIKNGNWNEVGSLLAEKVNGIITNIREKHLGQKLGQTINDVVNTGIGFLETFDWEGSAKLLTEGIEDLINTVDWGAIGKLFSELIKGSFDFADEVSAWISKPETADSIVTAITDFIKGIDWTNIVSKATTAAVNAINAGIEFISNLFTIENMGKVLEAIWAVISGILSGLWESVKQRFEEKGIGGILSDIFKILDPASATALSAIGKFIGSLLEAIVPKLRELWENVKNWFKQNFKLENLLDNISSTWGNFKQFANNTWEKLKQALKDLWQKVKDWFKNNFDISSLIKEKTSSIASNIGGKVKSLFSGGYATGGYPTTGQVFIARENGLPEMVGSIGNRTAVANNDQIVDAVSIGVYNAVVDAMGRTSTNDRPVVVAIDGREVFRTVQSESISYQNRTGQPAF